LDPEPEEIDEDNDDEEEEEDSNHTNNEREGITLNERIHDVRIAVRSFDAN
jgi:hypothetical protein